MRGVITGWDVLNHLPLIWREFGWVCAVRCLAAMVSRHDATFLEVAFRRVER